MDEMRDVGDVDCRGKGTGARWYIHTGTFSCLLVSDRPSIVAPREYRDENFAFFVTSSAILREYERESLGEASDIEQI